jgi:hypothetical protein
VSNRGNVVAYWAPLKDSAIESLTPDEAANLAREFILRHQPNYTKRKFISLREEVEENAWEGSWQEHPLEGEVSIFRNVVNVGVNLWTHSVTHYSFSDFKFIRTNPPKIKEEQARKIILSEFDEAIIEEIHLYEQPIEGGRKAITIWSAMVLTPNINGLIPNRRRINADTGDLFIFPETIEKEK